MRITGIFLIMGNAGSISSTVGGFRALGFKDSWARFQVKVVRTRPGIGGVFLKETTGGEFRAYSASIRLP